MRLLILCESCEKEYPLAEIHRVREADEGAYWNLCEACMDSIADMFDRMEAGHG